MKILGIDPGTALTGYAIVEAETKKRFFPLIDVGVIKTSADADMHKRLETLFEGLSDVVRRFVPQVMVVERIFFNTNAKTAMSVGQARGITLLVAAQKNILLFEYTALEAKKTLADYGRSDKKVMQEAVRKYMGLKSIIKPDDANDAVAMALCYIKRCLDK